MEYYSALKRKKILTYPVVRMNLEDILLNEINEPQNDRYCMLPLIGVTQSSQNYRDRNKLGGEEYGELLFNVIEFQFYKMKRVMEIEGGDGCKTK